MSGNASFNYRMLFDVSAPREDSVLVFQAWDRDLFKKNDYLAEWTIDLHKLLNLVRLSQQPIGVTKKFYEQNPKYFPEGLEIEFEKDDSFWLTIRKDGKPVKLRLDIQIMPISKAKAFPVGTARSEPNMDPYLMPPVGRIQLTMNPLKMMQQLVSPEFLRKIIAWFAITVCCVLAIMMIPMFISSLASQAVVALF